MPVAGWHRAVLMSTPVVLQSRLPAQVVQTIIEAISIKMARLVTVGPGPDDGLQDKGMHPCVSATGIKTHMRVANLGDVRAQDPAALDIADTPLGAHRVPRKTQQWQPDLVWSIIQHQLVSCGGLSEVGLSGRPMRGSRDRKDRGQGPSGAGDRELVGGDKRTVVEID
jgi:hypothetical protein